MKKNTILSEVELSYEELKCLEAHFRQMQNDAIVDSLTQAPSDTVHLLKKIVSLFSSAEQLKSSNAES